MYSNNTINYQTARFFRKSDTHMFAYCIEPFTFFNEGSTYESTITPKNLTNEQKDSESDGVVLFSLEEESQEY